MKSCSLHRCAHEHLNTHPKLGLFPRSAGDGAQIVGHRLLHKPREGSLPPALATPREERKWVRRQIRRMGLGSIPPHPHKVLEGTQGGAGEACRSQRAALWTDLSSLWAGGQP